MIPEPVRGHAYPRTGEVGFGTSRLRRLMWPAAIAAMMFLVLLGLGSWQLKRLTWKEQILDQIARAEAAPPSPLSANPTPFEKLSVTGRFRDNLAAFYGAEVRDTPQGPELGTQLIVPLQLGDGEEVLVDRGWVPSRSGAQVNWPDGPISVVGFARPPDSPGLFTPGADVGRRQFYALVPAKIGAALGIQRLVPFTLVALGPQVQGRYPIPAQHLPRPPNNHLQYALTWYGLAAALVAVLAAWARKVLRE